ncbi:phosphatidylinositol transfer protein csr1 [Paecilomyces lecythidis]
MSSTKSPPGHVGNLTEEQETKLREAWTLLGKFIGMKVENTAAPAEKAAPKNETPVQEKKKSRRSWFGFGGNNNDPPTSDSASTHSNGISITDGDDKYGTMKDFQQTIADKTPEQLRQTLWGMLKKDHPDALLLRFLRARKWDVNKAVIMLISTLRWRADQYHVDDDIILNGEEGALKKANDSNASDKRVASDFIAQYKMGKSFVHGIDKEGRPVSVVRVKTHKIGAHSNEAVEKFTVHQIETARLMLQGNVETVVS